MAQASVRVRLGRWLAPCRPRPGSRMPRAYVSGGLCAKECAALSALSTAARRCRAPLTERRPPRVRLEDARVVRRAVALVAERLVHHVPREHVPFDAVGAHYSVNKLGHDGRERARVPRAVREPRRLRHGAPHDAAGARLAAAALAHLRYCVRAVARVIFSAHGRDPVGLALVLGLGERVLRVERRLEERVREVVERRLGAHQHAARRARRAQRRVPRRRGGGGLPAQRRRLGRQGREAVERDSLVDSEAPRGGERARERRREKQQRERETRRHRARLSCPRAHFRV